MYRLLKEGCYNFKREFCEDEYYMKVILGIEVLVDIDIYRKEKVQNSNLYKEACELIEHIKIKSMEEKYRQFGCLTWELENLGFEGINFDISNREILNEQIEVIRMFLSFSYVN